MRKTFVRGGSVKVFVIMGIILSAIALAVLYFAGRQSISGQVPPMFLPESSEEGSKDSSDQAIDKENTAKDNSGTTKEDDSTKATEESVAKDSSQSVDDSIADKSSTDTTQTADNNSNPSNLPQTGPGDGLMQALAVVALSFSAVAYVRSMRL